MFSMKNKFFSAAMALIMFLGCFTVFAIIPAYASDDEEEFSIEDYTTIVYANPEEKLHSMEKVVESYGYELWYQSETGETAVFDTRTGQILLSNPYDVGRANSASSTGIKEQLLSQIHIKYTESDKEQDFNSYKNAALNGQITMKRIRGGIRVEYTIGKIEKRKLVPRMIEAESFKENILQHITNERERRKMEAYYTLKDATDPTLTERAQKELQITYPITKFMAIYIFDPGASERELTEIEGYIQQNTQYTFEMMDEDHRNVEYEATDKAPPLFKMALEYYLDEDGLYVRLPANGIRFDESTYKITYISVLPYMGAGRRGNIGYTFIPDGSGTIVKYEEIGEEPLTLKNRIYGHDYSFNRIYGTHTQKWRMPVFGNVEEYSISREFIDEVEEIVPAYTEEDEEGNITEFPEETIIVENKRVEVEDRRDGFLAIIEDGDAMAEILTQHGGRTDVYNTAYSMLIPRPFDQFNLDVSATGLNSMMTVSSRRKYAGNYIIRYIMLSGDKANYVGMAEAYRNYLVKKGDLTPMDDTGEDIPLFVETFGMIRLRERFLGFPYWDNIPLTSFEDVQTMIDDFNAVGINNLSFRMRGWANRGMATSAPTRVKVENALGGSKGLEDLVQYANSKGARVYPEMEFAMILGTWYRFDGLNRKRMYARDMGDLYSVEQFYWYLPQDFLYWNSIVISPRRVEELYDRAMRDYMKLNVGALASPTMGSELHSDQNKRHVINRQESKQYMTDMLEKMYADHGNLLVNAGNVYTLKYVDAVLDATLNGSRFLATSAAVPFYGMVTHGFIDITGSALNLAGDIQYDILKTIENGANPYFIMSYQSTYRLKEFIDVFNNFYSVDFTTWFEDSVDIYNMLNNILKPVRTKPIVGHEFLNEDYNIVKVTYEGGTSFILNYNNSTVEAEGYELAPMSFVQVR